MSSTTRTPTLDEFAADPQPMIDRLRSSGEPIVLSIGGRDVVIQDAQAYEKMLAAIDRAEANAAIREGLSDVAAGRVRPVEEVFNGLRSKLGLPERGQA